nr:hypothetical protein [Tanacetum cinerariifolium]
MIIIQPETIRIIDLKRTDINKAMEAKVYHERTARSIQDQKPIKFCCILLDQQVVNVKMGVVVKGDMTSMKAV